MLRARTKYLLKSSVSQGFVEAGAGSVGWNAQPAPQVLQQAPQHLLDKRSSLKFKCRKVRKIHNKKGGITVYSIMIWRLHFVICSCDHEITCAFRTKPRDGFRHAVQHIFKLSKAPSLPKYRKRSTSLHRKSTFLATTEHNKYRFGST